MRDALHGTKHISARAHLVPNVLEASPYLVGQAARLAQQRAKTPTVSPTRKRRNEIVFASGQRQAQAGRVHEYDSGGQTGGLGSEQLREGTAGVVPDPDGALKIDAESLEHLTHQLAKLSERRFAVIIEKKRATETGEFDRETAKVPAEIKDQRLPSGVTPIATVQEYDRSTRIFRHGLIDHDARSAHAETVRTPFR
jgi:hypothetical protein